MAILLFYVCVFQEEEEEKKTRRNCTNFNAVYYILS